MTLTNEKISRLQDEAAYLRADYQAIGDKLKKINNKIEKEYNRLTKEVVNHPNFVMDSDTYSELSALSWNISEPYEALEKWLSTFCGIDGSSGIQSDLQYTIPQISLSNGQEIDSVAASVREISKVIRYDPVEFGIFEHTLSEFGVYFMHYFLKEDRAELHKTTYGRDEILHEGRLERILDIISNTHYYE